MGAEGGRSNSAGGPILAVGGRWRPAAAGTDTAAVSETVSETGLHHLNEKLEPSLLPKPAPPGPTGPTRLPLISK